MAQFRQALERDGLQFAKFREEIRNEITVARVREREVDSKIVISEGEIDNYLQSEAGKGSLAEEFEVAHILLRSPESANPEQIGGLKAKADQVLERAAKGENFSQLAAAYSDNMLLTGMTLTAIAAALALMAALTWTVIRLGDAWGRRRAGLLPG